MSVKWQKFIFSFCLCLLISLISFPCFSQEQMTITTYYPAPYGVYNTLRLFPHDTYTPGAACSNPGEMYYDASDNEVYICDGTTNLWESLGWWTLDGNTTDIVNTNPGRVRIAQTLQVDGKAQFSSCIGATNIMASGTVWGGNSGGSCDLAEVFPAASGIEPGDVVVIDTAEDIKLKKATLPYDKNVAGIVSGSPGFLIGSPEATEEGDSVSLTLTGRVLCKVTTSGGPIKRGDLITTSSKSGYAMKLTFVSADSAKTIDELKEVVKENNKRQLAIIGKALEGIAEGEGEIMVLVK